jgi:hypothetical protein
MTHTIEISEAQLAIIYDALDFKRKHCLKQARRPKQTYTVEELDNRKQWHIKADDLNDVMTDLSHQTA